MPEFNEKSTADEVASAFAGNIKGKVILTTGVSSGSLGATYVQTLAAYSPKLLVLAGRNKVKLQETANSIKNINPDVELRLLILDLADQTQVRTAAQEVLGYEENIDLLCNNAAVMAQPFGTTKDGLEMQFGCNHIGHFLFTSLIFSKILASPAPRVINISSAGHRLSPIQFNDPGFANGYDKWVAYGQSKTANMLFSLELANLYGDKGLQSYSVHPGSIWTNLGTHLDVSKDFDALSQMDIKLGNFEADRGDPLASMKSLAQGSATHVFASFAELESHNGAYLLDCRLAKPEEIRSNANDPDQARKLWDLSEKLIGQKFGS